MGQIAKLYVLLGLDPADFERGLDQARAKLSRWGRELRQIGQTLTTFVTLPLAAAGFKAVQWAIDTGEQLNKVNVVFGDSADTIVAWSETTSTALGLAQVDALGMAGTFGNLLTGMGLSQEAAAGMSMEMIQLAADLASFNNVPIDVALEAIRSGLVGEAEPMRQFGVLLNEAAVQQKALELGIWDGTGAMTEQQKVLARQAIMMDQTTNAQGDFARTSDSLANRMRILRARVKDLGARIGADLLPLVEQGVKWFEKLLGWFEKLSPSTRKWLLALAGAVAILGPLLLVLGAVISAISTIAVLFNPVTLVILAVVAAIAALYWAYQTNFLGFADGVRSVIDFLQPGIERVTRAFQFFTSQGINPLSAAFMSVASFLSIFKTGIEPLDAVLGLLGRSIFRVGEQVQAVVDLVVALLQGDWQGAWDAAKRFVMTTIDQWRDSLSTLADLFGMIDWGAVVAGIGELGGFLVEKGKELLSGLYDGATAYWSDTLQPWLVDMGPKAVTAAGDLISTLSQKGTDLMQSLWAGIESRWPAISDWIKALPQRFVDEVGDLVSTLSQKGTDLMQSLWAGIESRWPAISEWIKGLAQRFIDEVGDLISTLSQRGTDLMQGLWAGIEARWPAISEWILGLPALIVTTIGDVTETLYQQGTDLLQGLQDGIAWLWANVISPGLGRIAQGAIDSVGNLGSTLYDAGKALLQGLKDGIDWLWANVVSPGLGGVAQGAIDSVGNLGGILYGAGQALMQGMIDGVKSMAGALKDAAVGVVIDAKNAVLGYLGIESPSKLFIGIGHNTMAGFAVGIQREAGSIERMMAATSQGIASAFAPSLGYGVSGTVAAPGVTMASGALSGSHVHTHNYFVLKSDDFAKLQRDAEQGAEIAALSYELRLS